MDRRPVDQDAVRAALAAAGPGALATGRCAARLWGIAVPVDRVEVLARRQLHTLPGVIPSERSGIGVVDLVTALLLMAPVLPPHDLVDAAGHLGVDGALLVSRAERWIAGRGPGAVQVRELIAAVEGGPRPDSVLEERFVRLLERSGVGRDATLHHRIAIGRGRSIEVDVAFPRERVVVELDGWRFHRSEASFRSDRSRDVELAAAGWVVLRFTHADVDRRPRWVLDQIRRTRVARVGQSAAPAGCELHDLPDR